MRGKQFAWISTDFQMSVIKIVIIILIMIINIIISYYHNIKIKYERQSGNCAGYLKRYTSIICSFIHQIFFLLVLFFWFGIVIERKETHAGWLKCEPQRFESYWRVLYTENLPGKTISNAIISFGNRNAPTFGLILTISTWLRIFKLTTGGCDVRHAIGTSYYE